MDLHVRHLLHERLMVLNFLIVNVRDSGDCTQCAEEFEEGQCGEWKQYTVGFSRFGICNRSAGGQMIEHERFGLGEVIRVEGTGDNAKATIH